MVELKVHVELPEGSYRVFSVYLYLFVLYCDLLEQEAHLRKSAYIYQTLNMFGQTKVF